MSELLLFSENRRGKNLFVRFCLEVLEIFADRSFVLFLFHKFYSNQD